MEPESPRLPRGRHRLSREEVGADQRRRLLGAAAAVFAERGARATSRAIAERAGVSSATFYAHYEGVDEVLAASFALTAGSLLAGVEEACAREPGARTAAAVDAALALALSVPARAALFGPQAVIAVAASAAEWERLTARLGELIASAAAAGSGRSRPAVGSLLAAAALATAGERAAAAPGESQDLAAELAAVLARV